MKIDSKKALFFKFSVVSNSKFQTVLTIQYINLQREGGGEVGPEKDHEKEACSKEVPIVNPIQNNNCSDA